MISIMPCLDMKDGRVVKGVQFVDIKDVGDPAQNAAAYCAAGADALGFLDISATTEGRNTRFDVLRSVCKVATVPVTAGGGIATLSDVEKALDAGAGKVLINSAAIKNPAFVEEAAKAFGSSRIVVAIDAKLAMDGKTYTCYVGSGLVDTGIETIGWAKKMQDLGAGELLPTSIDRDGALGGYDIDLTKRIADAVSIPVVASGGAGTLEHFYEAATKSGAQTLLAASLFHFGTLTVGQVKDYLEQKGVAVRR